ncbi:HpcH/HpaI aldolase family protein [Actinomyces weissii]|uniref:Uncharacterized protein n=1 Tax=Actinomyces weissii TaxID=675090 RepID=A0A7T7S2A6_9ACTO|nr:aldolase/citrate lyase family protein [Actinomyces weissii]QQM67407.1 hypothetical protein JG540_00370 [Actinomyces weissii]
MEDYLGRENDELVSLAVQVETDQGAGGDGSGVDTAQIAATEGGRRVRGASDLAASLGLIGQQGHPRVVEAVHAAITAVRRAGSLSLVEG